MLLVRRFPFLQWHTLSHSHARVVAETVAEKCGPFLYLLQCRVTGLKHGFHCLKQPEAGFLLPQTALFCLKLGYMMVIVHLFVSFFGSVMHNSIGMYTTA